MARDPPPPRDPRKRTARTPSRPPARARALRARPSRRAAALEPRTWAALVLFAALAWVLPLPGASRGALSAAIALAGAAALAEWMILLSSGEPYPLLASLPLTARRVWALRSSLVAAAAAATALLLALSSRPLDARARATLVVSVASATLLIGVLGVTCGVTLYPRTGVAGRLVTLWLILALVASILFPLAGWAVLGGALLHALLRLRRRPTLAADVAAGEA